MDTSASKENVSQFEPVEEVTPFSGLAAPKSGLAPRPLCATTKGPRPPPHPFLFPPFLFHSASPFLLDSGTAWSPLDRSTGYISFAGVCLRKTRSALSADVSKFCNLISTRLFPEEDDWSSLKDDGQW